MSTRLIGAALIFILSVNIPPKTASSRALPAGGDKTTPSSSIYDALSSNGLPIGLLPKGATNFSLEGDGRFEVYLDRPCNAKFESQLHYERNVSGRMKYGQIANLTGIAAQELFLWFPVRGIRVDVPNSGLIYFDVGVVFKQFSISQFETPPDCLVCRSITQVNGDFGRESI